MAFANVLRTQCLIPRKMDKQFIISLFSGAIINLLLNSILIPLFASVGAAISTLIAEGTVCVVQIIFLRSEHSTRSAMQKAVPFLVAGLGMFIIWNNRIVKIEGAILALAIKTILCGICYSLLFFICIGAKRVFEKIRIPKS